MIVEAKDSDFDGIWNIFKEVIQKGDTYAYPVNTTKDDAYDIWFKKPHKCYVYKENDEVIGTYYIKPNQPGQGKHVCNCGYMVSSKHRGKGVATKMCEHSQKVAIELGYKAMQFNFVASSNKTAFRLWKKLGFEKVGVLPKAFKHPDLGYIDAFVMFKELSF